MCTARRHLENINGSQIHSRQYFELLLSDCRRIITFQVYIIFLGVHFKQCNTVQNIYKAAITNWKRFRFLVCLFLLEQIHNPYKNPQCQSHWDFLNINCLDILLFSKYSKPTPTLFFTKTYLPPMNKMKSILLIERPPFKRHVFV